MGDRWQVRWRDEGGIQRSRKFPKRKGTNPETCAEAFDAQRAADTARGEWIDPRIGRAPFREYAPVWMNSRLHKTGTVDTYELHLRNHIVPVFGDLGLAAIRPTMVQQWVKDLQGLKGLAPRTIETIYVIFASIMRGAVRDGYLRRTPCVDIRLPEVAKTHVQLLSPHEVLALAAAMPTRYGLLVLLGAGAGLRQGEAFGLALDCVDQAQGMITVDQQVIVVDRRPILAPPKTSASLRDVPMPRFVRTPSNSVSAHMTCYAVPLVAPCCGVTTTTGRSGSPRSRRRACPLRRRSTTCGTRSPVPPLPKACRSPRSPAGSATSRSRQRWTSMGISSLRPAAGPVTPWTRRSKPGAKPCEPHKASLSGARLQPRAWAWEQEHCQGPVDTWRSRTSPDECARNVPGLAPCWTSVQVRTMGEGRAGL